MEHAPVFMYPPFSLSFRGLWNKPWESILRTRACHGRVAPSQWCRGGRFYGHRRNGVPIRTIDGFRRGGVSPPVLLAVEYFPNFLLRNLYCFICLYLPGLCCNTCTKFLIISYKVLQFAFLLAIIVHRIVSAFVRQKLRDNNFQKENLRWRKES